MRFILDTDHRQDSTVISKLDDTPLVELLLDNASTTPVDQILDGVTGDDNAKARDHQRELDQRNRPAKMPMNQSYYGRCQAVEERLIGSNVAWERCRMPVFAAGSSTYPQPGGNRKYPDQIRDSQTKQALYDFAQEQRTEGLGSEGDGITSTPCNRGLSRGGMVGEPREAATH